MANKSQSSKSSFGFGHFFIGGLSFVGCAAIAIVLLVIFCCCSFFFLMVVSDPDDSDVFLSNSMSVEETLMIEGTSDKKIAVIDITGIITSYSEDSFWGTESMIAEIRAATEYAKQEKDIEKVIIFVDSPGGETVASDLIYRQIRDLAAEMEVVTYIQNLGASGGYYIAVGTDRIFIHPSGITGSIGVILTTMNFDGLYEKLGIESRTFKTGRFKDDAELYDNNDNGEAEQIYQSLVNDAFEDFVSAVVEGRELTEKEVLELADGRVFSGKKAVSNGLADETGTFEEVVQYLRESGDENYKVVRLSSYGSFWSEIGLAYRSTINLLKTDKQARVDLYYVYH